MDFLRMAGSGLLRAVLDAEESRFNGEGKGGDTLHAVRYPYQTVGGNMGLRRPCTTDLEL